MVDGVTRRSYLSRDMHLLYSLESKKVISPVDVLVNQFVTKSLLTLTGCDVNLQLLLVAEGSCLISTTKISTGLDSNWSWMSDNKEFRTRYFSVCVFLLTLFFWSLFLVSLNFSLSVLPKHHMCIWEAFQFSIAEVGQSSSVHIYSL